MEQNTGMAVAVRPPSDEEIQQIRAKGKALALHKKETQELFRTLEGMEWGAGSAVVKGSSFSPQTRYALAQFCQITRANPMTQVDILGGKPYLNGNYWKDRLATEPLFIDLTLREITEASEAKLREQAKERREAYTALKGSDPEEAVRQLTKALALEDEADYIAQARVHWNPPSWATSAYEGVIRRWMNAAPIDAIRRGDIPMEEAQKWIVEVKEANWAGGRNQGKSDPVGNAEAQKTARTRTIRRVAVQAFSAWMAPFEEQISKAEQAIEAEWEIVQERPVTTPHTVATGNGEPEAGAGPAKALPVRGEPVVQETAIEGEVVEVDEEPASEPFDKKKAHGALFATLTAFGMEDTKDRKAWAKKNGLPQSTKDWGKAEYDRAMSMLMDPLVDEVVTLAADLNVDTGDLALEQLGKDRPEYAKDWILLRDVLKRHPGASGYEPAEEEDL